MDESFLSYEASRREYQAMATLGHDGFHAMKIRMTCREICRAEAAGTFGIHRNEFRR
jgi:hypothetical protein